MEKLCRRVLVYMNDEIADWLEGKALEGYKKTAIVRRLLKEQMQKEKEGVAQ
jgi:hypothetical protein